MKFILKITMAQHALSLIAKFVKVGTFIFMKIFYLFESIQAAFIGNGRLGTLVATL